MPVTDAGSGRDQARHRRASEGGLVSLSDPQPDLPARVGRVAPDNPTPFLGKAVLLKREETPGLRVRRPRRDIQLEAELRVETSEELLGRNPLVTE